MSFLPVMLNHLAVNSNTVTDRQTLLGHARSFLRDMAEDAGASLSPETLTVRWKAIEGEILNTGTYTHTPAELQFGAKLAWRNSNRCIGRHMWRSLDVLDARNLRTRDEVIAAMGRHLDAAWNGGEIRSVITIFPPRHPEHQDQPDRVRFANHQLMRYAGFRHADGTITGDPASADLTEELLAKGWAPTERSPFTALPWSIWIEDEETPLFDAFAAHPDWLHEVDIVHPDIPAFAELGIRWYAIPAISEMALVIGGITYPCAPFNGWYMETEIGARDLGDEGRYNLLPALADLMGLDRSSERTLWRDRAMVEMNRAVLHSFDAAGVRIGDHHELGAQFEKFCEVAARKGGRMTGDWSWLTPPMSASTTPQFHRDFDNDVVAHTNYFYQSSPEVDVKARQRTSPGPGMRHPDPFHLGHQHPTPRCPFGFDRK